MAQLGGDVEVEVDDPEWLVVVVEVVLTLVDEDVAAVPDPAGRPEQSRSEEVELN